MMATTKEIELKGGPPWGFRISHHNSALKIARVNPSSEASLCGMRDGDIILQVNGSSDYAKMLANLKADRVKLLLASRSTSDAQSRRTQEESSSELDELVEVISVTGNSSRRQNDMESKRVQDKDATDLPPLLSSENCTSETPTPPPGPVVWTPPGIPPSPKSFRSVKFDGVISPEKGQTPTTFKSDRPDKPMTLKLSTNINKSRETTAANNSFDDKTTASILESKSDLPKYQSPTVTLLKKAREGQLPKGASYIFEEDKGQSEQRISKKDKTLLNNKPSSPIPLTSKSNLEDKDDQREWYKRMYDNCHVVTDDNSPATAPKKINYTAPPHSNNKISFRPGKISEYNPPDNNNKYLKRHWALSDKGYQSDTTTTRMNKKEPQLLSPKEQRQLYVEIQKGLDIPFSGLCKQVATPPAEDPNAAASYIKSKVNIHYESPVLLSKKEYLPEEELRIKQEKAMKKFYEEQRHSKYLKELEDMESRRHSDYYISKSPIPLNRYDDEDDNKKQQELFWEKARVLYDFKAQSRREINLTKGTIVTIKRKVDSSWYEGINDFNKEHGIFPCSYVEILREQTHATAMYNFIPSKPIELQLVKGESVLITKRIDNNWYEGRIGSKIGIFPCNYVKITTLPETDNNKVHSYEPNSFQLQREQNIEMEDHLYDSDHHQHLNGKMYRSLYKYVPQNSDELELQEDDLVQVMERCDDGWYVGLNLNSKMFGTFPGNYVVKIC